MATQINEIWIGEDETRRKLEGAELEAFIADREKLLLDIKKQEQEIQAKQAAKISALAKLAALGLTPEEISAIS